MINNQKILLKFIQIHSNVNWPSISFYYKLSENFIREFKDKVDWYYISAHQKLSENFIREFQDKVIWYWISINQNYQKTLYVNSKIKLIGGIYQ